MHTVDVLENGLRVVTVPLPHLHTATVQLFARAGPRFEAPDDAGLSHFLEHMFFRGTDKYPSSYAINFAIEDLGGTLDAETARDYSMFQVTLAPDLIAAGIELFGEVFTRPRFADIDLEREIILEELAEDFNDDGFEVGATDISRDLLLGDHPLAARITGPRENIERFTDDDVWRHYRRLFVGRNLVLCVAGPLDRDQVVAAARAHLGSLATGELAEAPPLSYDQTEPRFEYVRDPDQQTVVQLAFRGVAEFDPAYPAQGALLRALDDGMSTPLHYRLADQLGLAYSIDATVEPLHDLSVLDIQGTTANAKVPALVREVLAVVSRFRDELVSPADLAKALRRFRFSIDASRDDAQLQASLYGGTLLYREPLTDEQRIAEAEAVTAEAVRDVARQVFAPDRLAVVLVGKLDPARRAEVRDIVRNWGRESTRGV